MFLREVCTCLCIHVGFTGWGDNCNDMSILVWHRAEVLGSDACASRQWSGECGPATGVEGVAKNMDPT